MVFIDNPGNTKYLGDIDKMAKAKYDKYFISGLPPDHLLAPRQVIASLSGKDFEGSHQYFIRWVQPIPLGMPGATSWEQVGHGPHTHKNPEVVVHLGTNPDDPMDLGGEVEMNMGPEMEKHIITKSTLVYIPANFIHAPWIIRKVTRPWIFITVCQEPVHTEKSFKEMVPEEQRGNLLFVDQGYNGDEAIIKPPKVLDRKVN
jgi:hypothetical protein